MEILELLKLEVLIPWLLGMLFGIFVGATPGLTATMAVALIVPISFYLPNPNTGLSLIIGVSFTAIFAGDIPATYLRIPGTPASAAATLDNHQMAKNGQARLALLLDLFCSALGGLISVILLMLLAPQLARFGLRFSNYEYFWLAVFGLSMSAVVSFGSTFRGLLAAALGIFLSTVGIDVVSGSPRFTFNNTELTGGIGFIPVMIGLFGMSEVLRNLRNRSVLSDPGTSQGAPASALQTLGVMWRNKLTIAKSSLLGTLIGALPGAGADIAAWAAYGVAQRTSKNPEQFGKGSVEGVIAPTSANNAAVGGAWIPALVFGIPGDAVTAIALGAMLMYNIKPGPLIFQQNYEQVQSLFMLALLTQFLLLPCGYLGIRAFGWILRLPRSVVMVGVVIFSIVGSFALRNSMFDVYLMVLFGFVGMYMESKRVPVAPLILGMILGPMVEENVRTGLIKSNGDFSPFITRPISLALALLLLASFVVPPMLRRVRHSKSQKGISVSG